MKNYIDTHSLDSAHADVLTRDAAVADLFDATAAVRVGGAPVKPQSVANWIINELPRVQRDRPLSELALTGEQLASLIALVERGDISSSIARDVLAELADKGGDPVAIVDRGNLRQVGDAAALEPIIAELMTEVDERVQQYRAGRTGLLGFVVGQVMARTQGRANPQAVNELVRSHLQG